MRRRPSGFELQQVVGLPTRKTVLDRLDMLQKEAMRQQPMIQAMRDAGLAVDYATIIRQLNSVQPEPDKPKEEPVGPWRGKPFVVPEGSGSRLKVGLSWFFSGRWIKA